METWEKVEIELKVGYSADCSSYLERKLQRNLWSQSNILCFCFLHLQSALCFSYKIWQKLGLKFHHLFRSVETKQEGKRGRSSGKSESINQWWRNDFWCDLLNVTNSKWTNSSQTNNCHHLAPAANCRYQYWSFYI